MYKIIKFDGQAFIGEEKLFWKFHELAEKHLSKIKENHISEAFEIEGQIHDLLLQCTYICNLED